MNSNKGFWIVIGVAALGAGAWYFTTHTITAYAKTIVKFGGSSNYPLLLTVDKGYAKAWAAALKGGKEYFTYNNQKYNTAGGKTAS